MSPLSIPFALIHTSAWPGQHFHSLFNLILGGCALYAQQLVMVGSLQALAGNLAASQHSTTPHSVLALSTGPGFKQRKRGYQPYVLEMVCADLSLKWWLNPGTETTSCLHRHAKPELGRHSCTHRINRLKCARRMLNMHPMAFMQPQAATHTKHSTKALQQRKHMSRR